MEIRQLKHFTAIVQTGSFTAAAQSLHIAQSALSISIKKFEQQLGIRLLRRDERKVSMTDEGKVLYDYALRILQQVDDANLAMDELQGLVKGEVRLGTPSMTGSYFFPEIVMAFKSHYPNLKMTVVEAGGQSIRKMLLAGELDIGVILNRDIPEGLSVDPLLTSQMVAVVGEHHELAELSHMTLETFFQHELVTFQPGYYHREFIEKACQEHHFQAQISFETNLLPMILRIVKREYAISSLLKLVTDHEPSVRAIPFEPPVPVHLALARRNDGYLSYANQAFIDFVKTYVS
ncbi:LysR family transcriptional regulator [Vibrio mangrovi]|uniref:HTH-type transcriptional regulator CynR n=1 Tax=Vibrio mangrovi TaxID=474394 RepID=A0A1Y6IMV5_9VIBR|nr:LysR family transcriptional regulator [Vibrio mangrovi]MDW6004224.1 LysR family transcriptional regulator [Vibrio mangrovi]SMR98977.1 HTH-type transcriptional regulator CynR [Vibrio mangrovi]